MTRSFYEALNDSEERGYFFAFVADKASDEVRAKYRDWLVARGDVRGEVLTVAMELERGGDDRAALLERLKAALPRVDPYWWSAVRAHAWVLNCGQARGAEPRVRFAFECPRNWEELTPTAKPGVRRCDGCDEDVYVCGTLDEAAHLAQAGRCIAVSKTLAAVVNERFTRMVTGRPHLPTYWAEHLFPDDSR